MSDLDYATECLKVSWQIVQKMPEFEKRHPDRFEKDDAIKMAQTVKEVYKELPNPND